MCYIIFFNLNFGDWSSIRLWKNGQALWFHTWVISSLQIQQFHLSLALGGSTKEKEPILCPDTKFFF